MAKTSIEKLLEGHLQDLIIPIEKPLSVSLIGWLMIGLSCLLVVTLAWQRSKWSKQRKAPKQVAKRKLRYLQNNSSQPNQTTVLQISKILREGFETPRLELYRPEEIAKWKMFIKDIEIAGYSNQAHNIDMNDLFKQANYWIKHS